MIREHLHTQHILLKNGIRAQYRTEDGEVDLRDAISGSWDRESSHLQMARRIAPAPNGKADPTQPSDYYTGRPDTKAKAREMAEMIFFGEMAAGDRCKGISEKDGIHTLRIVINSLESTSPLYSLGRPGHFKKSGMEQEQEYFADEARALQELQADGPMTFVDPETGESYNVQVEPILLARQVNVFARAESTVSSAVSGARSALETSREGWKSLNSYAKTQLQELREQLEIAKGHDDESMACEALAKKIKQIEKLIKLLDTSFNPGILGHQLPAEEEMLCTILLCRLLDLPQLLHCKSSTDRTSLAVIATALRQWETLGLPIPGDIISLLKDEDFKELLAANWQAGHAVTRNARGPHGVIHQIDEHGKTHEVILDHEKVGIAMNEGAAQCVIPAKILPARYLKKYGIMGGIKDVLNLTGKGLKKLGKTLFWSAPSKFVEKIFKKTGAIPVFSHLCALIGGLIAWPICIASFFIAVGLGITLALGRGFFEIGYPYAPDLPFKTPKNEIERAFLHIPLTALVFVWRILEGLLPLNDHNYWWGSVRPPFSNRLANWIPGIFVCIFGLIKGLLKPIFTSHRMFPDKVIDTGKSFIKERRLIVGGRHQKQFEDALKEVPSEASSLSDYNQKFRKRFLNPMRPVREIIYADTVTEAREIYRREITRVKKDEDATDGEINQRIYAQFIKDLGRGLEFSVDDRTFQNPDLDRARVERNRINEELVFLEKLSRRRGLNHQEQERQSLLKDHEARYAEKIHQLSCALAFDIYTYLAERSTSEDQLWRCLVCCQGGTAENGLRRSMKLLEWPIDPMSNAEQRIRFSPTTDKTKPIPVHITTDGENWVLRMRNYYELHRKCDDDPHAEFRVTTTINLESGQADIAWKLKKNDDERRFIPFDIPEVVAEEE